MGSFFSLLSYVVQLCTTDKANRKSSHFKFQLLLYLVSFEIPIHTKTKHEVCSNWPFLSSLLCYLCVKTSLCKTIHMKYVPPTGSLSCKSNSFSYQRSSARPRFETEAHGNSEVVYFTHDTAY